MELLFDADFIIYRTVASSSSLEEAIDGVWDYVRSYQSSLFVQKYSMVLSCPTHEGFRYLEVDRGYKQHRPSEKPEFYDGVREYMIEEMGALVYDKIEADDYLSWKASANPSEYIIVSLDKDMFTIPGAFIHRPGSTMGQLYKVSRDMADTFHAYQILVGDSSDGYKGAPGIGHARATKLLDDLPVNQMWDMICSVYKKKKLTEEDALRNARLAFLLRHDYFDPKKGILKMWEPNEWDYV